jgi:hypothetical protein
MRICPNCNAPTRAPRLGTVRKRSCGECGWGENTERRGSRVASAPSAPVLALMWIGAAVVIVGPYLAFTHYMPLEASTHFLQFCVGMALYLGMSNAFSPAYDSSDVGWCGGLIDNPFSYTDDWNRFMRSVVLFLLPGKIVGAAVRGTYRTIKA